MKARVAGKFHIALFVLFAATLATLVMADFVDSDPAVADTPESMSWPMLPGESLQELAGLFYPGNHAMQQRFISKTLELSHEINPNLSAETVFTEASTLIVPDLKALSKASKSKAFKPQRRHKGKFPPLHLSYKITDAESFKVSPEMQADFDDLSKRNSNLKDELQKLNDRLIKLQQVLSDLLHKASDTVAVNAPVQVIDADKPKKIGKAGDKPAESKPQAAPQPIAPVAVLQPSAVPAPKQAESPAPAPAKAVNFDSVVKPPAPPPQPQTPAVVPPRNALKSDDSYLLDSYIVEIGVELGVIVIALFLAFVAWRWIRKGIARQIRKFTNAQLDSMRKNQFDPNDATTFHSSKPGAVDSPDLSMLSIEEFESVVEEARIFMSMDRPAEAIAMLQHHLEEQPRSSLHPWIYLLDIYREQDQREEFIALGKRFHETFNVMAPLWHSDTHAGMVFAESIEEFPHIIQKLQDLWGTPEAKAYLEELISDNRAGERAGFSFEVIKEMIMLLGVIDLRDKKFTL